MISAFALTALAAAMLFHGVMLAARAQDAAAGPASEIDARRPIGRRSAASADARGLPPRSTDREVPSEGPAPPTPSAEASRSVSEQPVRPGATGPRAADGAAPSHPPGTMTG